MMDSETKEEARFTPQASGIRRPPRPPLTVGLAMQEGSVRWQTREALERIDAVLRKAPFWYWPSNKDKKGVD